MEILMKVMEADITILLGITILGLDIIQGITITLGISTQRWVFTLEQTAIWTIPQPLEIQQKQPPATWFALEMLL